MLYPSVIRIAQVKALDPVMFVFYFPVESGGDFKTGMILAGKEFMKRSKGHDGLGIGESDAYIIKFSVFCRY